MIPLSLGSFVPPHRAFVPPCLRASFSVPLFPFSLKSALVLKTELSAQKRGSPFPFFPICFPFLFPSTTTIICQLRATKVKVDMLVPLTLPVVRLALGRGQDRRQSSVVGNLRLGRAGSAHPPQQIIPAPLNCPRDQGFLMAVLRAAADRPVSRSTKRPGGRRRQGS